MEKKLRIILGALITAIVIGIIYELSVISHTRNPTNSAYIGYRLNTGSFTFPVAILILAIFSCLFVPIFIYKLLKTRSFSESAVEAKDDASLLALILSAGPFLLIALGAVVLVGMTVFLFVKDFFH